MVVGLRGNSFLNNPYQFVAREDQVTFLKSHGYKNVISVGLPFIYTGIPKADRSPGSVLIMPGHTLKEETNGSDYEEYVRFVEKLVEDFSQVVVCLHGIDYERGQARKAFERAGFPVIRGAAIEDSNSLDRMSFLFSRFEYVSTNLHGSHVYYAAARGCKVSIAGPPHIPDLDGLRKHVFYKNFPEGISYLPKKLALRRDANPFLYVSPRKAEPRIDWALNELGHHEKKSPQNLRKTLGWSPMQMFVTKQKQMLSNLINTLTLVKP
jgi:hypothetical protein